MGLVLMSEHELQRVEVLSRVLDGTMRSSTAASILAISPRQVQRLLTRYLADGAGAIRHGLRGRPSNNRFSRGVRDYALTVVRETYSDFGPTLAAEKLAARHGLKVSAETLRKWMAARTEDLLPVEYFHVVFTLPAEIAQIAFWNKKAVYDLLFRTSAETLMTIAADPKRLGARVGMTAVLHTWGSALTHHPHIHMIVPGGGLSPDGSRRVACRPDFFLHVRVLARLFRRLFVEGLLALHHTGALAFFGDLSGLVDAGAFSTWLAPFRKGEWVVYAKPPFGGPEAVLAYLSRYTHRVAISNNRLISADAETVAFCWKDYRIKTGNRRSVMRLATDEFIRRFLIHVLPDGFHRIRHYGQLASAGRKANIAKIRNLLGATLPVATPETSAEPIPLSLREPCPCCGGPMRIIEIFRRGKKPQSRAPPREMAA
jgi:hypothetical protein